MNSHRLLGGLGRTVIDLATTALRIDHDAPSGILAGTIVEGLDAVVLTMLEALNEASPEAREHFHAITRDRANVMQPLRQAYLAAEPDLSMAQKGAILILTNLAERALGLLGQFADQEKATEREQAG
ncbi:hypothetical protein [Labrys monachus]|uniref:Uncharacterized protein n=1 Tax=Labrys monachus TaxID=217067 RepID=A0ABU0FJS6_9HYPH|nr:hypothetical protein [Labrys monachus]MDQ0394305.1 hypothetical protein [Labrys monachus]